MTEIHVYKDSAALAFAGAQMFVQFATWSIAERGQFSVALSGGSTPETMYRLLGSGRYESCVDWKRVFFFFGDERYVPEDSPRSNYRLAHETFLSKLPLHQDSVRPWPTYVEDPKKVAEDYALEIEHFFQGPPAFDLMLLGLGADCHTASLFPHTPALFEKDDLAVANWVRDLDDYRFTVTFPLINDSVNTVFLVSGEGKAKALATVLEGDRRPDQFPAQSVHPKNDQLYWLVDEAAASLLENRERLHFRQTET